MDSLSLFLCLSSQLASQQMFDEQGLWAGPGEPSGIRHLLGEGGKTLAPCEGTGYSPVLKVPEVARQPVEVELGEGKSLSEH